MDSQAGSLPAVALHIHRCVIAALVVAGMLVVTATATAATPGALAQLAGTDGCLSTNGNTFDPPCGVGSAVMESTSVAVSPDDKNVYSVATDSSGIEVLSRDASTGAVTQLPGTAGCVTATGFDDNGNADACGTANGIGGLKGGEGPNYIVVSPDGKNVYTSDGGANAIAVFARDASSGALTQIQCVGDANFLATGCSPDSLMLSDLHSLVVSADGAHVYAASGQGGSDGAILMYNRAADGTLSAPADATRCVTLTGLDTNDDPCGQARALIEPYHVALSPDGKQLYVASSEGDGQTGDGAVVTLNVQADGSLVQPTGPAGCLGGSGTGDTSDPNACAQGKPAHDVNGVAVSPDGKNVYAASAGDGGTTTPGAVEILTRDPATGALSQDVNSPAGCLSVDGTDGEYGTAGTCNTARGILETYRLTVSPDGGFVYVASQGVCCVGVPLGSPSVDGGSDSGGNISVFSRASDGSLTQLAGTDGCISDSVGADGQGGTTCAPGRALEGAYQLALTSDCTSAYVASQDAPALAVLSRSPCLPPLAETNPATGVTTSSATLNGAVNPRGSSTTSFFEWGTSTSYGNTTASQDAGAGTTFRAVSARPLSAKALASGISGLTAGTTYHFRVVAQNQYGQAVGADQQFTTPLPPAQPAATPPTPDKAGPKVSVLGARAFGGSCSRLSVLRIRVSATDPSGISSVVVFVDNHRIRKVSHGKFGVNISAKTLRAGRHKIRVVATDTKGNKTTTTVVVRRCATAKPRPHLVAPQFTG